MLLIIKIVFVSMECSVVNNVLLLSPFFYPEPISTGKYNAILAKELGEKVDSVDVLCAHPIYPKWKVEPTNKQLDGITAIRGGKWLKFPNNVLLRRAVLEIWFFFFVFFKLLISNKKYTHIVPIFPPSLFMLLVPMLAKKAKVVGIVHDLQGVYAKQNAGIIKRIIFSFIKKIESKAFSCCDKLVFLSEDMKKSASKEYMLQEDKNVVHYPFVTIDSFDNHGHLEGVMPSGSVSLVYSGALGEKQAPELLAQFMEKAVEDNPDITAYIFSQGPLFDNLRAKYKKIQFHGLVDECDLPELLLRSTIQILPQAMGTSDGSLPSKLPNLLASGCKIICITDKGSELVRILNSYSQSVTANSWDAEYLSNLIEKLLSFNNASACDDELLSMFRKESLVETVIGEEK